MPGDDKQKNKSYVVVRAPTARLRRTEGSPKVPAAMRPGGIGIELHRRTPSIKFVETSTARPGLSCLPSPLCIFTVATLELTNKVIITREGIGPSVASGSRHIKSYSD